MGVNPVSHVLYHANCIDGFGAAWVVKEYDKLIGQGLRIEKLKEAVGPIHGGVPAVEYIPVKYGDEPPLLPKGASVAIVDFSYKRAILEELRGKVSELVVLDHHATAERDLQGLSYAKFDMKKSGIGMTWDHYFPEKPRNWLVTLIEDYDLWKFEQVATKQVVAALTTYPQEMGIWDAFERRGIGEALREGEVALRLINQIAENISTGARLVRLDGYVVPAVQVRIPRSEVADVLANWYPEYPFTLCYCDTKDGKRYYSLKSRPKSGGKEVDLSRLAEKFDGGGHKTAAGFTTELSSSLMQEMPSAERELTPPKKTR